MDEYETVSKIGDGSFGTVYLCKKRRKVESSDYVSSPNHSNLNNQRTNDEESFVAIKKMKKRFYNWDDCMQLREVRALKKLRHPNIVPMKAVIREDNNLYLVFEHMDENLYQQIRSQTAPFAEKTIKKIVGQVLEGLSYMHSNGFFHRDLKPENLLCQKSEHIIKIADFGLTRELDSKPPYTEYIATRWYRGPELLLHSKSYSWEVDIWALGCIMGELYTLGPMFPGRSELDQIFKICQVLGTPKVEAWPEGQILARAVQFNFPKIAASNLAGVIMGCTPEGLRVLEHMLRWAPKDRTRASDLLNSRYFS